ncbi:myrosinase 1-like [Ostrinia furnacalis]|uniref:myrosinase 1-like n=1 Tax=Ostrinia furnacalis TaxID=93504 RepID=UPI001040C39D|nr:myrosinase 1-like [Ostrinia furnacalis]
MIKGFGLPIVFCLFHLVISQENCTTKRLPKGLKLGVGSAAFQIEGAWDAADKTPSIWDNFSRSSGVIKDGSNAEDSCKSYEYYKRDVAMVKYLGVDFYRFSISWPRVLPTGFPNKISKEGSEYYSNLIDELLANGIEPVVTMFHWDLPQRLQNLGGWANPLIADWFEDYADVLFDLYGDRMKTWITINEPRQLGLFGYGSNRFAPGINAHGIGEYLAAKNIVMANAKAWRLYDRKYRPKQNGTCSITIATDHREGITDSPDDVQAALDAMDFEVGLYSHPIFTKKGGFPDSVVRLVAEKSKEQGYLESRLPEFTEEEIEFVKGTSDFFGFNHYSTKFVSRKSYKPGMYPIPSHDDDLGAFGTLLDYTPAVVPHCTSIPWGARKALKWVKENCGNPAIMIIENGFGTHGGLQDNDRVTYLQSYLLEILDAVEKDQCNVVAYTVWSLMDNFEWDSGLRVKFGIFETNYDDEKKTRTPRASAFWYKNLAATKSLDCDFKPTFKNIQF